MFAQQKRGGGGGGGEEKGEKGKKKKKEEKNVCLYRLTGTWVFAWAHLYKHRLYGPQGNQDHAIYPKCEDWHGELLPFVTGFGKKNLLFTINA